MKTKEDEAWDLFLNIHGDRRGDVGTLVLWDNIINEAIGAPVYSAYWIEERQHMIDDRNNEAWDWVYESLQEKLK